MALRHSTAWRRPVWRHSTAWRRLVAWCDNRLAGSAERMTDEPAGQHPAEHHEPLEVRVSGPHGQIDHRSGAGHDLPDNHDVHDPDEAHDASTSLGPVDTTAWAVGILGVAIGLLTAFCFALSTGYIGL